MNEENTRKLFTDFDRLFRGRTEPQTQSRMYEGISCGNGWFDLVCQLCVQISEHARNAGLDPKAFQVKEKIGSLCFHLHGGDEMTDLFRSEASKRSRVICDGCGGTGTTQASKYGWYRTACPDCREKSAKKQAILKKLPQSRRWPFEKKYIEKLLKINSNHKNQK